MSDSSRHSPFTLFGKYFDGSLSSEEATELLDMLEHNQELGKQFYKNYMADLGLTHLDQLNRNVELGNISPLYEGSVGTNRGYNDLSDVGTQYTIESLIHFERTVPPLRRDISKQEKQPSYKPEIKANEKRNTKPNSVPATKEKKRATIFFFIRFTLFICAITWLSWQGSREKTTFSDNDSELSLATIVDTVDCIWADDSIHYGRGRRVANERFLLKSGIVRLRFDHGSELIMEGPADFVLNDSMCIFCNHGKASVSVSKAATGFQISTPFGKVIDRGTKFFLQVDQKETQVAVVKGKVDLCPDRQPVYPLTQNSAASSSGQVKKIGYNISDYMDQQDFDRLVNEYSARMDREMNKDIGKMKLSPNLLARFDFNSRKYSNAFANLAPGKTDFVSNISTVGTQEANGVLTGKTALAIRYGSDRVSTSIRKECENVTLVLRARIESLHKECNVLLCSENFFSTRDAILWQVLPNGAIQFQIRDSSNQVQFYTSEAMPRFFWTQWHTYSVVVNQVKRNVSLYIDGKCVLQEEWSRPSPLKFGKTSIGTLSMSDSSGNHRQLHGEIQDLYIFDSALSKNGIRNLVKSY